MQRVLKNIARSLILLALSMQGDALKLGQLYQEHPNFFVCALNHQVPELHKTVQLYELKVIKQGTTGCNVHAPRNVLGLMEMLEQPEQITDLYANMTNKKYLQIYEHAVGTERMQGMRWLHDFDQKMLKKLSNNLVLPRRTKKLLKKLFDFRTYEGFPDAKIVGDHIQKVQNIQKILQDSEHLPPAEAFVAAKQVGALSFSFLDATKSASLQSTFVQDYSVMQKLLARDNAVLGFTIGIYYPDAHTQEMKSHIVGLVVHQSHGKREYFFMDSDSINLATNHHAAALLRGAIDQCITFLESPTEYKNALLRLFFIQHAEGEINKVTLLQRIRAWELGSTALYKSYYKAKIG